MDDKSGIEIVRSYLDVLPKSLSDKIIDKLKHTINYEPVIGVMGKTGAGKSSLCNAIFRSNICEVSDIGACTREVKRMKLTFGKRSLILIDIPGVGESKERDEEYKTLYRSLLPELDIVLWVLKGDDRAFASDEYFYHHVIKTSQEGDEKIVFVLNQIDKIEPYREWDTANNRPSPLQRQHIKEKQAYVEKCFHYPRNQIVAVSANDKYNIDLLVEEIIRCLPKHAKSNVIAQVDPKNRTDRAVEESIEAFGEGVSDFIDNLLDVVPLPSPVKTALKATKGVVVSAAKKVWGFFFG
ncbi:GTPase family protein [Budvicia aquatica]|uniref:Ferrous iron transporter B n=1 Tax=Budvicia aquatica TaxID=82979 RepID=A0A2C6DIG8_9GAMM|nr:GTPase [Budvicia aquatica]PHI30088.1 ferrous iron transporter B [Budvicia aquatica]VFS49086.1 GTPase Era [Budvicia aquatica]